MDTQPGQRCTIRSSPNLKRERFRHLLVASCASTWTFLVPICKKTFLHSNVQERECTRIEVSLYACRGRSCPNDSTRSRGRGSRARFSTRPLESIRGAISRTTMEKFGFWIGSMYGPRPLVDGGNSCHEVRPHKNQKGGTHPFSPHHSNQGGRQSMGTCRAVGCGRFCVPLLSHLSGRHSIHLQDHRRQRQPRARSSSMLHQRGRYEDHLGLVQETDTMPSRCNQPQYTSTRDEVHLLDLAREEPHDWVEKSIFELHSIPTDRQILTLLKDARKNCLQEIEDALVCEEWKRRTRDLHKQYVHDQIEREKN